jgi:hypothetical protein
MTITIETRRALTLVIARLRSCWNPNSKLLCSIDTGAPRAERIDSFWLDDDGRRLGCATQSYER